MKVLSIIIPVYNTELYLERCLDSLLFNKKIIDCLDIIIVNDGSTDSSLSIAKKYKKQFPDSIKIIDKPNGGHGSTINAGIKVATGKYLKVLDSDDWVDIDNFSTLIEKMSKESSDMIITNVERDFLYDESTVEFIFEENDSSKIYPISDAAKKINEDNFFFEFSMHSISIKTEKLKKVWDDGLLEKTFYVDQQFVAKVFMCAENYVEYGLMIYHYFFGRPEQSMGAGFFKHISDHERVLKWLLSTTNDEKMPDHYKTIVSRQIALMLNTHYNAYYDQSKLSKNKKKEIREFNKYLSKNYKNIFSEISVKKAINFKTSQFSKNPLFKLVRYYKGVNR